MFCTHDTLCVLQVFYCFSFWLMFRQQLEERQEEQSLKEESLDEVKVEPRNLFSNCFYKDYSYCVLSWHVARLYDWLQFDEKFPSPLSILFSLCLSILCCLSSPFSSSSFSSWFPSYQRRKVSHRLWWQCWSQEWKGCWWNTGSSSAALCSLWSASLERYLLTDLKTKCGRSPIHDMFRIKLPQHCLFISNLISQQ